MFVITELLIWGFFSIHFTITGLKIVVFYTEVFARLIGVLLYVRPLQEPTPRSLQLPYIPRL